jgi:hypothetical protein
MDGKPCLAFSTQADRYRIGRCLLHNTKASHRHLLVNGYHQLVKLLLHFCPVASPTCLIDSIIPHTNLTLSPHPLTLDPVCTVAPSVKLGGPRIVRCCCYCYCCCRQHVGLRPLFISFARCDDPPPGYISQSSCLGTRPNVTNMQ